MFAKSVAMRRYRLGALGVLLSSAAYAGPGFWTSTGPNGGGVVDIAVSAAAPNTVYAASSAALFKSTNSGATFVRVAESQALGFPIKLVASATDANLVYLLNYGSVLRSTNGGSSFAAVTGGLPTDVGNVDLVISPADNNTLYLATSTHGAYKTTNGGTSWTAIGAAVLPSNLGRMAIDPTNAQRLVFTPCPNVDGTPYTGATIFRSTNGGTTVTPAAVAGAQPEFVGCATAVAFSPNTAGLVLLQDGLAFTGAARHYLRSTDGGASFTTVALGTSGAGTYSNFQFVPGSPTQVVAGSTTEGAWMSNDAGLTWTAATGPTWPPSSNHSAIQLLIKPGDSTVRYYASQSAGFFRSTNSGLSYVESNLGLRASNIRSIALNPSDPSRIYAGQSDLSGYTWPFFRSMDGAASWSAVGSGSALDWMRGLLVDANTSAAPATTVIYGVGRDVAPSVALSLRASTVAKSVDGGNTFVSLNNFIGLGGPSNPVGSLGTSRAIVPDRSVVTAGAWSKIYLTATGRMSCSAIGATPTLVVPRIWRTLDAGTSWNTIATAGAGTTPGSDGLPVGECFNGGTAAEPFAFANYPTPVPIVVDPITPNTLYVGTFLNGAGLSTTAPMTAQSGVFKSTDGGVTWLQRSTGLPRYTGSANSVHSVLSLAMDPNNVNILYASTSRFVDDSSEPGNLYKTVNGGTTWTQVGPGLSGQDIRAIAIDPSNSLRVLVASGGSALNPGGVFISENGGATWDSVSAGLPIGSSTSLAIDASNSGQPIFYSGTRTGVYAFTRLPDGDGDGAPSVTEAAAPNGGDGNGDGIPDATQSNVASPGNTAGATRAPAPFSVSVEGISGSCNQLYDVVAVDRDAFGADPTISKPDGAFRFEIAGCTQARVTIRINGVNFDRRSVVRLYGPRIPGDAASIDWNSLPVSISGDRISFVLTDNGPGDGRSDSQRILFQGGPGFEPSLFGNGFE